MELGDGLLKKGFTLIELIALIIILAVIALIAVPTVTRVVEDSRKSAFKVSVEGAINAIDKYLIINKLYSMPQGGLSVKDLELKNSEQFISGNLVMSDHEYEAVRVTNGRYCVSGKSGNLKIATDCYKLDETPPIIDSSKIVKNVTSNSIKVLVPLDSVIEEESGIKNYTYELTNEQLNIHEIFTDASNSHIFNGLRNDTTYNLKITLTNLNDKQASISTTATTLSIDAPTYSIDKTGWATSKTVTITYPIRQDGFVYSYSTDSGETWRVVENEVYANYTFTNNGSIIAKIYDGTNYKIASSYTVSGIDTTLPNANIVVTSKTTNSIAVAITASDDESGIIKYEYSIDNSTYVDNGTSAIYTYTDVTSGSHNLRVLVTNGAGLKKEVSILANPNEILVPTYSVDKIGWATSKTITITYPVREVNYIYSYSVDNAATWTTVQTGTTTSYKFNSNGSIIARIYDGTNYKLASSYSISQIDSTSPTIPAIDLNGYISGTWTNSNVIQTFSAIDSESGIQKYQYTMDGGNTWNDCPNPWTISVDGSWDIRIRAVDNVGNISSLSTLYKIYRDTVVPIININPSYVDIDKGTNYNLLSGVSSLDNASGVSSITSTINNTSSLSAGIYIVNYIVRDNAGNVASGIRTLNVYVTWYRSRSITPATYYGNYTASSSTSYYCPSGYTSSGSGSSMTCTQNVTTSSISTSGSAYCSEPTYSISGSSCVRTVSCTGCSGQGSSCMNQKCGSGGYENSSWTCGTSSCTATMLIRYSCPSGYTNNTIYTSACYACPSGYTASGTGSSTTCSKNITSGPLSNTTYSCPSGGTLSGATCIRSYYVCSTGTLSGASCYSSWGTWTKTVLIPSTNLEVETETRLTE
jgi:prepilin-type N-terminal cleavage/methylation domain-containing protein